VKDQVIKTVQNLPSAPGVYLFKNGKGEIIYIGKAVNLKNRVRSYFQKKLLILKRGSLLKDYLKVGR